MISFNYFSQDVLELGHIKKQTSFAPVFFIRVPPHGSRTIDTDPPDGAPRDTLLNSQSSYQTAYADNSNLSQHIQVTKIPLTSPSATSCAENAPGVHVSHTQEQLRRLGYLDSDPDMKQFKGFFNVDSYFIEKFTDFGSSFASFSRNILQSYVANASTVLNNSHTRCLNMFILSAFDMARDMLITPKKLEFAREKEDELYKALMKISVSKLDDIKEVISNTISIIRPCLIAEAAEFDFVGEYGMCVLQECQHDLPPWLITSSCYHFLPT